MRPLLKSTRMTFPLFVLAASLCVPFIYAGERVMQPDYGAGTSSKASPHSDKKIRNTQSARKNGNHGKWIDVMSYSSAKSASKVKIQGKQLLLKNKSQVCEMRHCCIWVSYIVVLFSVFAIP